MSKKASDRPKDNSTDPLGEFTLNVPEQIFYLLFQAIYHRDARLGERLEELGFTLARWRTLAVIRRIGNCSMKELSRFSTIDRTTLTRSVDQLVAEKLVSRHIPPEDRRLVLLSLTAEGEAVYMKAVGHLLDLNRQGVAGIPADDLRTAARVVKAILNNLIPDPEQARSIINFGR